MTRHVKKLVRRNPDELSGTKPVGPPKGKSGESLSDKRKRLMPPDTYYPKCPVFAPTVNETHARAHLLAQACTDIEFKGEKWIQYPDLRDSRGRTVRGPRGKALLFDLTTVKGKRLYVMVGRELGTDKLCAQVLEELPTPVPMAPEEPPAEESDAQLDLFKHGKRNPFYPATLRPVPSGPFDESELRRGRAVEQEHTPDPRLASMISRHHLAEDPRYYTHLDEMERKYARGNPKRYPAGTTLRKPTGARTKALAARMKREEAPWLPVYKKLPQTEWARQSLGAKKPDQVVAKGKFRFVWAILDWDSKRSKFPTKRVVYTSKEYTNPTYKDAWREFRKAQQAVVKEIGPIDHVFLEAVKKAGPGKLSFGTGS